MIESGFSHRAVSSAQAVGYWQFIYSTGKQYGLKKDWWLDERRDIHRSTFAAARYLKDLYALFGSWELTLAGYNMGENKLQRLIKKYGTKNYWRLSEKRDFPRETRDYVPKLMAAILISQYPPLYGFQSIKPLKPQKYEFFYAPGGAHLFSLAKHLDISSQKFLELNPALTKGFIPKSQKGYWIRIPKGRVETVANYVRENLVKIR